MGDYYDLAAQIHALPRPERISRAEAKLRLPAMTLSFMGESRRLNNGRMKQELRFRLHYPDVESGIRRRGQS